MKTKICILSMLLAASLPAWAGIYTATGAGTVIPDNNTLGTGNSIQFIVSGESSPLTALTLTFSLQGGVSTDLSGYLRSGDTIGSPSYDLTTLIQGSTLSAGSPTSYSIDFTTPGFNTAFNGTDPNNTWTLFFADNVNGDQTTFTTGSLTAVPEPVNVALVIFGMVLAGAALTRRYFKSREASSQS